MKNGRKEIKGNNNGMRSKGEEKQVYGGKRWGGGEERRMGNDGDKEKYMKRRKGG